VVLALLSIKEYSSSVSLQYERVRERNELKQQICALAGETLSDAAPLFTTFDDEDKCFIALADLQPHGQLERDLMRVGELVLERLAVATYIFVSSPSTIDELPTLYTELMKAYPYKTFYTPETIITSPMVDARLLYESTMPESQLRQLSQAIMQLDVPSALLNLEEVIDEIAKGSYKSFQINLMQLIVTIDELLTKVQTNNGIEKTISVDTMLYNLSTFETLAAIFEALKEAIEDTEQVVIQNKNSHQTSLIAEIQQIIQKSYIDDNFSIIDVSEQLGMNASYLGKLFKRSTGMTFIEFLHKERMLAACTLLATTDMPIAEVVTAVGFKDVPYFYKIFKKEHGCTPKTYRVQYQESPTATAEDE